MKRNLQPDADLLQRFPEFDRTFAELVIEFLEARGPSTFAELQMTLSDLCTKEGDIGYEWVVGQSNVVLWSNFTLKGISTLVHLKHTGVIELDPCPSFYYMMDGCTLTYPIAKRPPKRGYTKPHWVPTVLSIKK